jgi:hypothetical protein
MAIDFSQIRGLYHFNSGGINIDNSSNGNNLTTTGVTNPAGKLNEAIFTDIIDDTAYNDSIIADLANDTTGNFTFWLDVDSLEADTDNVIFSVSNNSSAAINKISFHGATGVQGNQFLGFCQDGGNNWLLAVDNLISSFSGFIQITLTHNGIEPSVYINNVLQSITFLIGTDKTVWMKGIITDSVNPSDRFAIGNIWSNGLVVQRGKIKMDELVISGQHFTATEVSEYWNGGLGVELIASTNAGIATAEDGGDKNINVSMSYTDDFNTNNSYTVDYKLSSDSVWTNWVTEAPNTPSPFTDTIEDLAGGRLYDVRVTYVDPDGVTGTNPQIINDILVTPIVEETPQELRIFKHLSPKGKAWEI